MAEKENKSPKKQHEKADVFHYLRALVAVFFGVFLILACYFSYLFGRAVFTDDPLNRPENAISAEIEIVPGDGGFTVGRKLEQAGIIDSGAAFFVQTKLYKCRINPGNYTFSSSMSSKSIAKYLESEFSKSQEQTK